MNPLSSLTSEDDKETRTVLEYHAPLSEIVRQHMLTYFHNHSGELPASGVYDRCISLVEKPLIEVTLQATAGNQLKAARVLGINRNTLRKKIAQLGIVNTPKQPS
jgi:DNA-binding protein Fis